MKYIITESRLNDFIIQYLDSWLLTKHSYDFETFIIIENILEEDYDSIIMEHDNSDGRLWFNKNFRKNLMDLFNKSAEEINHFVSEWFEYKFGEKVEYVD